MRAVREPSVRQARWGASQEGINAASAVRSPLSPIKGNSFSDKRKSPSPARQRRQAHADRQCLRQVFRRWAAFGSRSRVLEVATPATLRGPSAASANAMRLALRTAILLFRRWVRFSSQAKQRRVLQELAASYAKRRRPRTLRPVPETVHQPQQQQQQQQQQQYTTNHVDPALVPSGCDVSVSRSSSRQSVTRRTVFRSTSSMRQSEEPSMAPVAEMTIPRTVVTEVAPLPQLPPPAAPTVPSVKQVPPVSTAHLRQIVSTLYVPYVLLRRSFVRWQAVGKRRQQLVAVGTLKSKAAVWSVKRLLRIWMLSALRRRARHLAQRNAVRCARRRFGDWRFARQSAAYLPKLRAIAYGANLMAMHDRFTKWDQFAARRVVLHRQLRWIRGEADLQHLQRAFSLWKRRRCHRRLVVGTRSLMRRNERRVRREFLVKWSSFIERRRLATAHSQVVLAGIARRYFSVWRLAGLGVRGTNKWVMRQSFEAWQKFLKRRLLAFRTEQRHFVFLLLRYFMAWKGGVTGGMTGITSRGAIGPIPTNTNRPSTFSVRTTTTLD